MTKRLRRLEERLAWRFPVLRPISPEFRRMLNVHREEVEDRENEQSRLPDGESIQPRSAWVAEFYSPSEQAELIAGLRRLGWDNDERRGFRRGELIESIQTYRSANMAGSTVNLGIITRPGDSRFLGGTRHAPLPGAVDYAIGVLQAVTPALTVVVMQFVWKPEVARMIDQILRQDRPMEFQHTPHSLGLVGPAQAKRRAARREVDAFTAAAQDWFREHLPGVFARGLLGGSFPRITLITTRELRPFSDEDRTRHYNGYASVFGFEQAMDAWRSSNLAGLLLSRTERGSSGATHDWTLAGKWDEIMADRADRHDRDFDTAVLQYLQFGFVWTVAELALNALIDGYQRRLAMLRDALIDFNRLGENETRLRQMRSDFLGSVAGITPVLAELANELKRWHSQAVEFEPAPGNFVFGRETSLLKANREFLTARVAGLTAIERGLRDLYISSATVGASIQNIRVAEQVKWLTVVIGLLAAVSAFWPIVDRVIGR